MRLLLTGAGGFIGSNLLDRLDPDLEVHLLTRSGAVPAAGDRPSVTAHRVDLLDHDEVARAVERVRPSHLGHLAWLGPEHADRYRSPENERWAEASRHLFRTFARCGGERLVHLGSCIEYGNAADGPRSEDLPLAADTAYGRAKADLARFLTDGSPDGLAGDPAGRPSSEVSGQVSAAIARLFFCYGPHEQPERLVPSIILALARGESIDLTEGRQRRDYLDARDVALALVALLDSDATGAFNVGSGRAVEVRAIAEELGRLAGRPELLNFGARPEGADTAPEIVADIERIGAVVGWRPTISLERGLAETTDWWLDRTRTGAGDGTTTPPRTTPEGTTE